MAHANLHMAAGMLVGTAATAPQILLAWRRNRPVAWPVARLLIASYGAGVFALLPNLLGLLGATATVHEAWWADLFILHGAIDRRTNGGLLIGELIIAAGFVGQYVLLLLAIRRADRLRPPAHEDRAGPAPPGSAP